MALPMIVALLGHRGAGKDAIAEVLCREAGYVNVKFARPLKDALVGIFGLSPEHVDGALKDVPHPHYGVTPRTLMQWFGTEVMQHGLSKIVPGAGRTFWADRLVQAVRALPGGPEGQKVVISDMRFPHEIDALKKAFGDRLVIIRVTRPGSFPETADALAEASDPCLRHESETAVDAAASQTDLEITNDGSLEHLHFTVRTLLMFGREYSLGIPPRGVTVRLVRARRSRLAFSSSASNDELREIFGFCRGSLECADEVLRTCSVEAWCQARATPTVV